MSSKGKKQIKVVNENEKQQAVSSKATNEIPKDVQDKLEAISEKIKEIYEQNKKKMLEIEHKYNEQMSNQFKKRGELLSKTKDFEGFWSSVLTQAMIDNFADNDQAVVDCLVDMKVENTVDVQNETTSKKITFYFKDNSIFKNKEISKENIIDKNGDIKVNTTKIDYIDAANNKTTTTTTSNNNKKRKQNFSESSFILSWLESDEPDVETLDEFSKLYEDPFSVLLEEDQEEDQDDDDEDDVDQDDDDEEDDE